jgi:hypothetical protein
MCRPDHFSWHNMLTRSEIELITTLTYWTGMILVLLSATVLPMLEVRHARDRDP